MKRNPTSVLSVVRETLKTIPEPFTSEEVFDEVRSWFGDYQPAQLKIAVRNSIRYLRMTMMIETVEAWRPRNTGVIYRRTNSTPALEKR